MPHLMDHLPNVFVDRRPYMREPDRLIRRIVHHQGHGMRNRRAKVVKLARGEQATEVQRPLNKRELAWRGLTGEWRLCDGRKAHVEHPQWLALHTYVDRDERLGGVLGDKGLESEVDCK